MDCGTSVLAGHCCSTAGIAGPSAPAISLWMNGIGSANVQGATPQGLLKEQILRGCSKSLTLSQ